MAAIKQIKVGDVTYDIKAKQDIDGNDITTTYVKKDGEKVLSTEDFTTELKNKLGGIANNANNYTHPTGNGNNHIPQGGAEGLFLGYSAAGTAKWVDAPTTSISTATSTTLGGIKIGYTLSNKNYPIVLDGDEKAYVVVPWTDTVYTHPTTAGNKHIPAGGSSGLILKWTAAGTAVWGAEKSYSEATTGAAGLMSAADKTKLDGFPEMSELATKEELESKVNAENINTITVLTQTAYDKLPLKDGTTLYLILEG